MTINSPPNAQRSNQSRPQQLRTARATNEIRGTRIKRSRTSGHRSNARFLLSLLCNKKETEIEMEADLRHEEIKRPRAQDVQKGAWSRNFKQDVAAVIKGCLVQGCLLLLGLPQLGTLRRRRSN